MQAHKVTHRHTWVNTYYTHTHTHSTLKSQPQPQPHFGLCYLPNCVRFLLCLICT